MKNVVETAQVIILILRNFKTVVKILFWILVFIIMTVAMMTYGIAMIFGSYDVTNPSNPVFAGGYCFPLGVPYSYTSFWGEERGDSIHHGVDMAVPDGTPLYAVQNGEIDYKQTESIGGIAIGLKANDGNWYYYAHLNGYAPGIKKGSKVTGGQVIAYSGNTGKSTGPHLHFGIKQNGRWINPLPFLEQIMNEIKILKVESPHE